MHLAEFSNQTFFFPRSKSGVSRALFSDKARLKKPITILDMIVQLIDWLTRQ